MTVEDIGGDVVHVAFARIQAELPPKPKPKKFIFRKDPITRAIDRVAKEDIGSISKVSYYDGDKLID